VGGNGTYPCNATSVLRRTLQSQASSSLWPRSTVSVRVSKHPPMGYGTKTKAVMAVVTTNRFVKISAGSERLEIRRYEDADERIDLNGVQEDCWKSGSGHRVEQDRPTEGDWPKNSNLLLRIANRAAEPLSQASQPGLAITGGWSHSSTYGFQKVGPLPLEATVCSHTLCLAMARFLRRKKLRMIFTCSPMASRAATEG